MVLICTSAISGWIAGGGDTTCQVLSCNLSDDTGYKFVQLDFDGSVGFSDLIDNGANSSFEELNVSGNTLLAYLRGNVGIGTDSPTALLQINDTYFFHDHGLLIETGTGGTELTLLDDNGASTIEIIGNGTGQSTIAGIEMEDSLNGVSWWIQNRQNSNNDFWIQNYDGAWYTPVKIEQATPTNTLYIDNNSRIGIKTDSPGYDLHLMNGTLMVEKNVSGDYKSIRLYNQYGKDNDENGTAQIYLLLTGDDATARNAGMIIAGKENDYSTAANRDSYMALQTASNGALSTGLYIDSDQEVGIGTSDPTQLLHLYSDNPNGTNIIIQSDYSGSAAQSVIKLLHSEGNGANVTNGRTLGKLRFEGVINGSDAYDFTRMAVIRAVYKGDSTTRQAQLEFETSHDGIPRDRMVISSEGYCGINVPEPIAMLHVNTSNTMNNVTFLITDEDNNAFLIVNNTAMDGSGPGFFGQGTSDRYMRGHTNGVNQHFRTVFFMISRDNSDPHFYYQFDGVPKATSILGRFYAIAKNSSNEHIGYAGFNFRAVDNTTNDEKGAVAIMLNEGGDDLVPWSPVEVARWSAHSGTGCLGIDDSSCDFALEVVDDLAVSSTASGDGDIFVVESGGDVGIDNSDPDKRFYVHVDDSADGMLIHHESAVGNYACYYISADNAFDAGKGAFCYEKTAGSGRGTIHLLNNNVADGNDATLDDSVLTILNSGYVGVNQVNPSTQFDVNTTDENVARFSSADSGARIIIRDDDTVGYVNTADGVISLGLTGGLNALNLNVDSSGFVGIGTTTPDYRLHVIDDGVPLRLDRETTVTNTGRDIIELTHNSSNDISDDFGGSMLFNIGDDNSEKENIGRIGFYRDGDDSSGKMILAADDGNIAGGETITLRASGAVGIGENNPFNRFEVSHTSAAHIGMNNTDANYMWSMGVDDDGDFRLRDLNMGLNVIGIEDGAVEDNIYIDSTSYVGINTNSPKRQLHVDSGAGDFIALFNSTDASGYIQIGGGGDVVQLGTTKQQGYLRRNGNTLLGYNNTEVIINDGSGDRNFRVESDDDASMLFIDGGTDRMGIGTTEPQHKLHLIGDMNISGTLFQENDCGIPGTILVGERGTVASNQFVAYGNGQAGWGVAQACSGTITAITAQCNSVDASNHVAFQAYVETTAQDCDTDEVTVANQGYLVTNCTATFNQGDSVACRTKTETGAVTLCTCALYLRYD